MAHYRRCGSDHTRINRAAITSLSRLIRSLVWSHWCGSGWRCDLGSIIGNFHIGQSLRRKGLQSLGCYPCFHLVGTDGSCVALLQLPVLEFSEAEFELMVYFLLRLALWGHRCLLRLLSVLQMIMFWGLIICLHLAEEISFVS